MKESHQVKKRRKYDLTFKAEALKMVENGRSVSEVSQALGIGENRATVAFYTVGDGNLKEQHMLA